MNWPHRVQRGLPIWAARQSQGVLPRAAGIRKGRVSRGNGAQSAECRCTLVPLASGAWMRCDSRFRHRSPLRDSPRAAWYWLSRDMISPLSLALCFNALIQRTQHMTLRRVPARRRSRSHARDARAAAYRPLAKMHPRWCEGGEGTTDSEQDFESCRPALSRQLATGRCLGRCWKQRVPAEASSYSDGRINNSAAWQC
jgi:hypothetical protein